MSDAVMNGVSAMEITAAYEKVLQGDRAAFGSAIAFGEVLLRAQGNSRHGTFGKWLDTNCPSIKKTVAYEYIKLAKPEHRETLEANFRHLGSFSMRGAMRLILTEAQRQQRQQKAAATRARRKAEAEKATQPGQGSPDLANLLQITEPDELLIVLSRDHASHGTFLYVC
jgi:hypothetical protein